MWKCLSELLPEKTKSSPKGLIKDEIIETNKKKMANMFNDFIYKYWSGTANKIPHFAISDNQFPVENNVPKFHFSKVKPSFVLKELQSLPVNKAVGLN